LIVTPLKPDGVFLVQLSKLFPGLFSCLPQLFPPPFLVICPSFCILSPESPGAILFGHAISLMPIRLAFKSARGASRSVPLPPSSPLLGWRLYRMPSFPLVHFFHPLSSGFRDGYPPEETLDGDDCQFCCFFSPLGFLNPSPCRLGQRISVSFPPFAGSASLTHRIGWITASVDRLQTLKHSFFPPLRFLPRPPHFHRKLPLPHPEPVLRMAGPTSWKHPRCSPYLLAHFNIFLSFWLAFSKKAGQVDSTFPANSFVATSRSALKAFSFPASLFAPRIRFPRCFRRDIFLFRACWLHPIFF